MKQTHSSVSVLFYFETMSHFVTQVPIKNGQRKRDVSVCVRTCVCVMFSHKNKKFTELDFIVLIEVQSQEKYSIVSPTCGIRRKI